VFSFTFGIPARDVLELLKSQGMLILGTATTVCEATLLEQAGVDGVIAQGSEAGGHRATFDSDFAAAMIGSMVLVPLVADAVSVPVIASGGIMDGRGLAAVLLLGAQAVQMGTAFLTSREAGTSAAYREAIRTAREDQVRTTSAFSGRPARGIGNAFMVLADLEPGAILPYPWQNAITRPMRTGAAAAGTAGYMSLWAGQGLGMARSEPAADIVARIVREAGDLLPAWRLGA
jgi:nitronate monooxygenase